MSPCIPALACVLFAPFVAAPFVSAPALANSPALPGCDVQLGRAAMLVERVAARDRAGPIADRQRLCRTLRQNRADMIAATGFMRRCLTGHARAENLGQMEASIVDVTAVINRRCR